MTDLDKALARLHEKRTVTLRHHEFLDLARLADAEADRYLKRANRRNAAPYTASANIKSAGSYKRLAEILRAEKENS